MTISAPYASVVSLPSKVLWRVGSTLALAGSMVGCGGGDPPTTPDAPSSATPSSAQGVLVVRDVVVSRASTSRARTLAASPNPLPADTVTLSVLPNEETHVRAYTYINPLNCAYIENGAFTELVSPSRGQLRYSTEEVLYGGACPGPYLSAVARYTWTDPSGTIGDSDFFSLRFTTTSGAASAGSNWLAVLGPPVATPANIRLELPVAEVEPRSKYPPRDGLLSGVKVVVSNASGGPVANVAVRVAISDVESGSGGHIHGPDDSRPRGTLGTGSTVSVGETSVDGSYLFDFYAPEVAGVHTIVATCDGCTEQAEARIVVRVPGLIRLSDLRPLYELETPNRDTNHPDNHYLLPQAADALFDLSAWYFLRYSEGNFDPTDPRLALKLNDSSLVWGGLFDCFKTCTPGTPWGVPHKEHRRGIVVDVKSNGQPDGIPLGNEPGGRRDFYNLARSLGMTYFIEGSHIHLRLLGEKG